ncbi:MAG: hypothetical protein IJQ60_07685 [Prevotella sp.]|nr:hypothetical protein [Prevotella sp.]
MIKGLRIYWVGLLELCGKAVDVWSTKPYPANVLSNLYPNAFEIDGVKCASMEGFLQSLKYSEPQIQEEICVLSGKDAKERSITDWQTTQTVYWQGKSIGRQSSEFLALLSRAYQSLYLQNETFRTALDATKGKQLYHTRGLSDSQKTILTEQEFCKLLMEIRQ